MRQRSTHGWREVAGDSGEALCGWFLGLGVARLVIGVSLTVTLVGCGAGWGAPREVFFEDVALLRDADEGHFLPPTEGRAQAFATRRRVKRGAKPTTKRQAAVRRRARRRDHRRAMARRRAQRRGRPSPLRQRVDVARRPAGPARPRLTRATRRRAIVPARDGRENPDLPASQRVRRALALLGTTGLARRAFVDHILHAAGAPVRINPRLPYAAALWQRLRARRVQGPRAGDLVFFKDTLDLNSNSRPDDGVTWVAVVERVEAQRVLFIGQRAGKVRRMSLDTSRPRLVRDAADQVVNTRLVRWPRESRPRTAGQCFAGYARP